jgi:hypothetical protein
MYGLPVAANSDATYSLIRLPIPIPWKSGAHTTRCSRQPETFGCGNGMTAVNAVGDEALRPAVQVVAQIVMVAE